MTDPPDDQKLTDAERFWAAVDEANANVHIIPLGEQLCARNTRYNFTEENADGIMLATFTIHHAGQERPTNYTGMITLLNAATTGPDDQPVTELTIRYCNDRGYDQKVFPLRQLQRLMSHLRTMGSYVFCIRNGVLVREEKTRNVNDEETEGSHAANPNQANSRVA